MGTKGLEEDKKVGFEYRDGVVGGSGRDEIAWEGEVGRGEREGGDEIFGCYFRLHIFSMISI